MCSRISNIAHCGAYLRLLDANFPLKRGRVVAVTEAEGNLENYHELFTVKDKVWHAAFGALSLDDHIGRLQLVKNWEMFATWLHFKISGVRRDTQDWIYKKEGNCRLSKSCPKRVVVHYDASSLWSLWRRCRTASCLTASWPWWWASATSSTFTWIIFKSISQQNSCTVKSRTRLMDQDIRMILSRKKYWCHLCDLTVVCSCQLMALSVSVLCLRHLISC